MAILRIAAAVGALALVAPHLPRTLLQEGSTAGREAASRLGEETVRQLLDACRKAPAACADLARHLPAESVARAALATIEPEKPARPAPSRTSAKP